MRSHVITTHEYGNEHSESNNLKAANVGQTDRQTHTHIHTQSEYNNPRVYARRALITSVMQGIFGASLISQCIKHRVFQ